MLFKLENEIRDLQRQGEFERKVNANERTKKQLTLLKGSENGPMKIAMI